MHYKLTGPYGFRDCKQPVNSSCRDHKGHVRAPYGQIRHPCGIFANYGCVNSLSCLEGRFTTPMRVTHSSLMGPVGYEKHWRFPCGACTMPVRALHGVSAGSCELFDQTISMQTCQAIRGPVAWCDQGDSTDVKFLRALHSDLRARNRTGDKNCMGMWLMHKFHPTEWAFHNNYHFCETVMTVTRSSE